MQITKEGRVFLPARISDNYGMDREKYEKSLSNLEPVRRKQLLEGDWDVRPSGGKFKAEWFIPITEAPKDLTLCRYWDLAATEPEPGKDPDWSSGVLLGLSSKGQWYILDVKRAQSSPLNTERLIQSTARRDGINVRIRMEQEPGASGVITIDHYARSVLVGYNFKGIRSTGSKEERANPVSSAAEAGNVFMLDGPWNSDFLDEIEAFPVVEHDDQVDGLSGAFAELGVGRGGEYEVVDMSIERPGRGTFSRGRTLI